jgi:PPOX class probable F420-dependent enzyme
VPVPPVPATFNDLLQGPVLGHLATVDSEGRPRVNPVWTLWDGEQILLSMLPETKKYANLRRDPHLAISMHSPTDPMHYLELRGEVVAFVLYEDLTFVNLLARKYTGSDSTHGHPGQHRYKVTIQINSWNGR